MRVEVVEIGEDVGALVVDTPQGSILLMDPRLPRREQCRLLATLLNDEEFAELFSPYPILSELVAAVPA